MIPDPIGGLAVITLTWMVLWWVAGRRRPLSPLSCMTIAVAFGVLALSDASTERPWWALVEVANVLIYAHAAGERSTPQTVAVLAEEPADGR